MNLLFKLAIRNIARNSKRSLITILSMGLGLSALIVSEGVWKGMLVELVNSSTETYLGDYQIQKNTGKELKELNETIPEIERVEYLLDQSQGISSYSKRLITNGVVASAYNNLNIQMVGVEASKEAKTSIISSRLLQGKWDLENNKIVIGSELAKKLEVQVGQRVVLTMSPFKGDELKQVLVDIVGIFHIGAKEFDERLVFASDTFLHKNLLLPSDAYHQICIRSKNDLTLLRGKIEKIDPQIQMRDWKQIVPELNSIISMSSSSMMVMGFILFGLVSFGILNTVFMSIFEREYEFAVLQAVGTQKRQLVWILSIESILLGLLASIVGLILAFVLGMLMKIYGIDYQGINMGGVTLTKKIYFVFYWPVIITYPFVLMFFTWLITLYPTFKLIRINISNSLKIG